jgi:hypothetical protein
VDRLVLAEISTVIERLAATNSTLQNGLSSAWTSLVRPDPASGRKQHVGRIEQIAATARRRITRATELFVDGSVDREAYDALVAKAREELAAAESDLALIRRDTTVAPVLPPLETVLQIVGGWTTALISADVFEQRDVLSVLVERVIPHRVGTGRYEVDIQWTPLGALLRSPPSASALSDSCPIRDA